MLLANKLYLLSKAFIGMVGLHLNMGERGTHNWQKCLIIQEECVQPLLSLKDCFVTALSARA